MSIWNDVRVLDISFTYSSTLRPGPIDLFTHLKNDQWTMCVGIAQMVSDVRYASVGTCSYTRNMMISLMDCSVTLLQLTVCSSSGRIESYIAAGHITVRL